MPFKLDPALRQYATDKQWERLVALEGYGSHRKAAKALGCQKSAVTRALASVRHNAAKQGYAPDHGWQHPVPHGFHVKGVSTLRDMSSGEAVMQWEKSERSKEELHEAMRQAIDDMVADAPRLKPIASPKSVNEELLNLYVLTDFHMGMLAWHEEGGADWDVKIATRTLTKAFQQMMAMSPDSEVGFICQLGDFLHTDYPALAAATPMSGHSLDADGRPHKVINATIEVLRSLVDMALTKHKKVVVLMGEGNHDITSSIWLQCLFSALYERDERVEVIKTPLPYYAHQHGSTALFFHHGHLSRLPNLSGIFAAQFPSMWGSTKYRYAHAGHYHHKVKMDVKEDAGVTVTQHRTLAAKDAYSSRGGYFSERRAECITYDKKHGQVASVYVSPEMVDE